MYPGKGHTAYPCGVENQKLSPTRCVLCCTWESAIEAHVHDLHDELESGADSTDVVRTQLRTQETIHEYQIGYDEE